MACHGLLRSPTRNKLNQSQLNRIVTVMGSCLLLDHYARSGLDHGDGDHRAILAKQLRHPNLNSKNAVNHKKLRLLMFLPVSLDLNVDAGREVELHQSI